MPSQGPKDRCPLFLNKTDSIQGTDAALSGSLILSIRDATTLGYTSTGTGTRVIQTKTFIPMSVSLTFNQEPPACGS